MPFKAGQGNNATPVVDGTTVYLTGQGKGLAAIRLEKKDGTWSVTDLWHNPQLGARFATPLLKNGLLYGCARNLFCANATTGETLWTADFREGDQASIIDAGPVILVLTVQSNLIVLKPGEPTYKEVARYHVADSETWAHPVVSGKRIFIRDRDSVTLWQLD